MPCTLSSFTAPRLEASSAGLEPVAWNRLVVDGQLLLQGGDLGADRDG